MKRRTHKPTSKPAKRSVSITVPDADAAITEAILENAQACIRGEQTNNASRRRLQEIDPDRRVTDQLLAAYRAADVMPEPPHKQRPTELNTSLAGAAVAALPAAGRKALKEEDVARTQLLVKSLDIYIPWAKEAFVMALQPNDCSRIHKVLEASNAGLLHDFATKQWLATDGSAESRDIDRANVFVVRHDWAAAFGDSLKIDDEFKLPFDNCAFEFRVSGHTVIMIIKHLEKGDERKGAMAMFVLEGTGGVWFTLPPTSIEPIAVFLMRQVRAICVALEARVAEHTLTRAPSKLNEKRAKASKPPLRSFHIIDLSRRSRASSGPRTHSTGRGVRLHFRRGHWRHFEDHKTWIEWMLVGNPDLGFIDKQYRI